MFAGYESCQPLTAEAECKLIPAAGAVELLHAFLLVHDDIIDRDTIRHGVPTVHENSRAWVAASYDTTEADRYGASLGILAGDIAAMLAVQALSTVEFPPSHVGRAVTALTRVAKATGYGEQLDVLAEIQPTVTPERVLLIHKHKTAKYTIEGPLHIGALLAGASVEQLAALTEFAVPLGIAYQLQDDLLGAFGRQEDTGKSVGADLREGKRTLLTVHALQGPFASDLRKLLGNPELTPQGVVIAQELLDKSGSRARCEQEIQGCITTARSALASPWLTASGRRFLHDFLEALSRRSS
ncbi:MAG: polyprenyl synthetase family protein [Chloroflexi bacterium]|nr:polyprenyl synthetase family protein [Chloroflexota bacterium]